MSSVLGYSTAMNVIVPQKVVSQIGQKSSGSTQRKLYKVLYLLHGLSDDYSVWARRTSIDRYAGDYNVIVVMPDGARGFYTDAREGEKQWTFLTEELPQVVSSLFPVSTKPEDTYVAGLSMGGYGALKWAFREPEKFAGAAGLSSVTDIHHWMSMSKNILGIKDEMVRIFGNEILPEDDLFAILKKDPKGVLKLKLFMACGFHDFMLEDNIHLRDCLRTAGCPNFHYEESEGAHDWTFWDQKIQEVLKYFFRSSEEVK